LFDIGCIVSQLNLLHVVQSHSDYNVFTSPLILETEAFLDSIQVSYLCSVTASQRLPELSNTASLSSTIVIGSVDNETSSFDDKGLIAKNYVRVIQYS